MLVVTLSNPSNTQMQQAERFADVIELRSDLYNCQGITSKKPIMLTGPTVQGVDAFWSDGNAVGRKKVSSYHNFNETPDDLWSILEMLESADVYKVVTHANSTIDALRMLAFVQEATKEGVSIVGHCMGPLGVVSRILGPIYGSVFSFACSDKAVAPGQLTAEEMVERYHCKTLTSSTKVFGLIGDPIDRSQGHVFHNQKFSEKGLDAIYVKMHIQKNELDQFFPLAEELSFSGLSVTMPLKEAVLPYVKSKHTSCNTLLRVDGEWKAYNTDGAGALNVIERVLPIRGKIVTIIGAGGTAKAIAFEAKRRGATVNIMNRTASRGLGLAATVGGHYCSAHPSSTDVWVNTTPVGFYNPSDIPIPTEYISPHHVVFDAAFALEETRLVREAKFKGCSSLTGADLFHAQAELQSDLFGSLFAS